MLSGPSRPRSSRRRFDLLARPRYAPKPALLFALLFGAILGQSAALGCRATPAPDAPPKLDQSKSQSQSQSKPKPAVQAPPPEDLNNKAKASPENPPTKAQAPKKAEATPSAAQPTTAPPNSAPKQAPPAKLEPGKLKLQPGSVAGLHFIERIVADPAQDRDPKTLPVLLMIHGLGDRPEGFIHISDAMPEPPRRELALRGFDAHNSSFGKGWSWFPVRVKHGRPDKLARGLKSAAGRIAKALRQLNRQEQQPQRRFAVTGFSQGGMLSFALAVLHPDLIEFAVPVGGWLPPKNMPKRKLKGRKVPILALHGKADKIVPYEPTERAVNRLKKLGYDAQLEGFAGVGHSIPPAMRGRLFEGLLAGLKKQVKTGAKAEVKAGAKTGKRTKDKAGNKTP